MTTDLASLFTGLLDLGFVAADATLVSDRPILGLTYWTRTHEGQPQYVGLCSADGEFLEATVEVYATKRNPRGRGTRVQQEKSGAAPIYANIARTLEGLIDMVSRVYEVATEKPKTPPARKPLVETPQNRALLERVVERTKDKVGEGDWGNI